MRGRQLFSIFQYLLKGLEFIVSILPARIFMWGWPLLDLMPSYLGLGFRYVFLKRLAGAVGDNVFIGRDVEILGWSNLHIGNNVSIHKGCYLDATGGITIENDVSIAHATSLVSFDHTWSNTSLPIRSNACDFRAIHISNDVWVGCGARVLSGVNIASRSIVAAGAVVNKDVVTHCIVGGVPAKVIRKIKR